MTAKEELIQIISEYPEIASALLRRLEELEKEKRD